MDLRRLLAIAIIAFVAAIAGVAVARAWLPAPHAHGTELHELLHDGLDLDSAQRAKLEALEHGFGLRKRALEAELRADNARLAAAIEAEHAAGPGVDAAVDATHHAMGELQKATLAHVFAMRAILRPEQAAKFDQAVVKALTVDAR